MKTKNLFCALALTVTAILFAPLPVAASVTDLLEMSEKIDQADKQDLLTLIDKANGCTRVRNFSCSEEQLRKAARLANGSKDKLALNTATQNLHTEQQRVEEEARARAEQERQIQLAEKRRREEEDQAEESRRLAQRQEQRRQDAEEASARAPTFAQSIQSSLDFSNDLTKIRNNATQETNRRIQENRDRADAQRRAEERATADRREDERSNQRAADRRAQDAERTRQAKNPNGVLILNITTNEAELAAKAAAEKKFAQDQKDQAKAQEIADRAEKKAEAEKRAAAEAKRKAQFQIVTAKDSDYQLEKHQTEKWCKDSVERLRKSFSTGRNQLISVGVCRCTPPKEALMSYGCEYPYTYKEFESSSK